MIRALIMLASAILVHEGGATEQDDPPHLSIEGHADDAQQLAGITTGTIGEEYIVQEHATTNVTLMLPPTWDSTSCMRHWERPELQYEPDPNGYVMYVSGREQLGANRNLLTDGIFVAKTLNRTLVEYPAKDARVSAFEEDASGLGIYWHLDRLCMYHRILDLRTFQHMVADGTIPPEGQGDGRSFVTISIPRFMNNVRDEARVVDKFREFEDAKVVVLDHNWRSFIEREEVLRYLEPNPFYKGVVLRLLEQTGWGHRFVAVQWRTEMSTGDLCECYQEVKAVVEEHRLRLGYGADQVLFNIDLFGKTSGTYSDWKKRRAIAVLDLIREDYPQAFDNPLHKFFAGIKDTGVQAIVSGLVVASAEVMIGSSLNDPGTRNIPEVAICQKPSSNYVLLIARWRQELLDKPLNSTIRLFPFTEEKPLKCTTARDCL